MTVFSGSPRAGALRLFGGGEWLWGKSMLVPLFGGGFSIALPAVQLVAEAERRLINVPYERVAATYRQRQLVDVQRETHHRQASRWAFRLGVELALPRG